MKSCKTEAKEVKIPVYPNTLPTKYRKLCNLSSSRRALESRSSRFWPPCPARPSNSAT